MVLGKAKRTSNKATNKIANDNERGARKALLEELFYDFHRSKLQVYQMNFMRGLFFALGSLIGGSVAIVIIVSLLNTMVDLPGGIGNFVQDILDAMSAQQR
jgi:hypothetical protein